ncbi:MAG: heavy metal translocating P-type ATPase [Phycisphaerales bacterium JB059]
MSLPVADRVASAPDLRCDHCAAPVLGAPVVGDDGRCYCCTGCRSVRTMLESGVFEKPDDLSRLSPARGRGFEEMDTPAFEQACVEELDDGLRRCELVVDGMHCVACVTLLERLARVVPGVVDSRVAFGRSRLTLTWDPARVALSRIARAIEGMGYLPHRAKGAGADRARRGRDREMLVRVGVAGALAGNVMLIAVAMYAGLFDGMVAEHARLFRGVSAGLGALAVLWPGSVFFRGALASLRTRTANLDLPIAVSLSVGTVWGLANAVRGEGEIYFDSLATLVFLLLVGRWIQHTQQRRAASALELLFSLAPSTAHRIGQDGRVCEVPADSLDPGDLIEVRPEESLAADGVVESGESAIDAAMLTGESRPEPVARGSLVSAGTLNLASTIRVRVHRGGAETRAAKLMDLVARATSSRARVVQLADRLAGWFVPAVLSLALLTVAIWQASGVDTAIEHATALLIVCCPCALGLATPMVMTVTIGALAKRGVLVKDSGAIEALAGGGRLLLDKTGTLTEGAFSVIDRAGDASVWGPVGAIEASSTHPVGRAIARAVSSREVASPATEVVNHSGLGVEGVVDGRRYLVGSERLMTAQGVEPGSSLADWARTQALSGGTPVLVARDGRLVAAMALGDRVRDGGGDLLRTLGEHGWRSEILSGDRPEVVDRVAERLEILGEGACTPETKVARVRELVSQRGAPVGIGPRERVVMVGDGVNDAAALATADVGIGVHGAAEVSLEAAHVAVQRPGLEPIGELFETSRRAMRRIRVCLGVSLGYNGVAAGLAMSGALTPLLAAVLMPLSSLTVLTIAMRPIGRRGRP